MTKGFGYSLLIHSLLILSFFIQFKKEVTGAASPGGSPEESGKSLIPKDASDNGPKEDNTVSITIIKAPKKTVKEESPCEDDMSFGGIGIQHDIRTMEIIDVPSGYPAALAGIRVGDILLNPQDIRGEIGTPVTVYIGRGGELLTFQLIRDKICFKR